MVRIVEKVINVFSKSSLKCVFLSGCTWRFFVALFRFFVNFVVSKPDKIVLLGSS